MKQGKIFERTLSALTSILAALLGLLLPPQQSHCCEKMVTFVVFGGMWAQSNMGSNKVSKILELPTSQYIKENLDSWFMCKTI